NVGRNLTATGGGHLITGAVTVDGDFIANTLALTLGGNVQGSQGNPGKKRDFGATTLASGLTISGTHLAFGSLAGPPALTLSPTGSFTTGSVGGSTPLISLTLNGGGTATYSGATTLGILDLSGKPGGSVTFAGAVHFDLINTGSGAYSIAFNGGGTIADPTF